MATRIQNLIEQEYKRVQLIQNIKLALQEQSSRQSWKDIDSPVAAAQDVLKGFPNSTPQQYGKTVLYKIQLRSKSAAKIGGISDVLTFYPDGTLRSKMKSAEYNYTIQNGVIEIFDKSGNKQGILTDENGESLLSVDSKELEQGGTWVDTLQTVLDWAGLIPVIGDAIDIINAIIYAAREKYFDAALSAIAVIPVAGSVLKLSIKNIGKPVAKFAKGLFAGSAASKLIATRNFWTAVQKAGVITPKIQRALARGLSDMGQYITKTKKTAKQFNFDSVGFMKILDDIEAFFTNSKTILGKSGADIYKKAGGAAAEFSQKQLDDLIRKVPVFRVTAKEIGENPGFFKRLFRAFSINPLKMRRLKALFNMNTAKLDDIALYIKKTFDDKLMNPTNISDLLLIAKSMPASTMKNIKLAKGKNFKFSFEKLLNNLKTPQQFEAFAKQLQQVDPVAYKEFASDIITIAKQENNFIYFSKLSNSQLKIAGIVDPKQYMKSIVKDKKVASTIASMYTDYIKSIKFMGAKQLDIWSNELQDVMDELGLSQDNYSDNKDSVFMAVAIEAIKNSVTKDQYQNAKEAIKNSWITGVVQLLNSYPFVNINMRKELEDEIYIMTPGNTPEEKTNNAIPKLKSKSQQELFQEIMDKY